MIVEEDITNREIIVSRINHWGWLRENKATRIMSVLQLSVIPVSVS